MTVKEIRTVEFVVLPVSRAKARKMFQIAGACRYVWNIFWKKNLTEYQAFKNGKGQRPHTSYFSLGVEFTRLRYKTDWLLELPANPIKHTLKYFADALKETMAGKKGFPKPRSRNRHAPTFTLPSKENFRIKNIDKKYSLLLISRVGWVTLARRGGNPWESGVPKQAVLRHDGHRWRAFVSYEVEVENPGRNVRQKAELNRAMLDTVMGEIRRNLEYKCGRLIKVNPAYTSQTCSHCGHAEEENRKSQARFQCVSCGYVSNADTNAAINIRRLGMAQLHGEERSVLKKTPTTREIDARQPDG